MRNNELMMGAGASSAAAAAAPAAAAAAIYYSEDIRYSFNTLEPLNLFSGNSKQVLFLFALYCFRKLVFS